MCTDHQGPKLAQKAEIKRKHRQKITGFVPRARIRPTAPAALAMPEANAYPPARL